MAQEKADNINPVDADTAGAQEVQVQLIDGVCVVTTNDVSSTLSSPIVIEKPAAGQATEIEVVGGQKYVFDFSENNVESFVQEGDNLTLSFNDGSSIQLIGFGTASSGIIPTTLAFTGEMTPSELQSLIKVVELPPTAEELEAVEEEPQAEVRGEEQADAGEEAAEVAQIEPAAGEEAAIEEEITPEELAEIQEELAQIEPAAGDTGAGGGADAGGAGFQSSFTPQGVIPIEDVGPIGPTALQYQIPEFQESIFAEEAEIDFVPEMLSPEALNLDETNLDNGPISQNGTVNVDFGADGPGTITPDGSFTSGGSLKGGDLSSNGQLIDVQPTADGYVGTINGGADVVFELTINPNTGAFEFTQFLAIDHADGTDPNDVIQLNFGVVATDADGDAANTEIIVNIADDAPAQAAPDSNTVNESALTGGPIVVNDTLVVDFGQDGPGAVSPNGTTDVTGVTTLTSNGQPITITQTADGYVGTLPGGAVAFELEIDPSNGSYTYTQNVGIDHNVANDTITIDFGVNVSDYDMDNTATTISININDSVPTINDKPKLGDGLEVVDETDLPGVSTSGQLTVDFAGDTPGEVTANDTFSSGGSQLNGQLTSNGVPVTVTLTGDTYTGSANGTTIFTLQVNTDGSYTFTLLGTLDHADPNDPNDIIDLNFGVTATDADGDTDSTTIIVKVKDDVPVIGDATGDVDETNLDGGPISTSDTLFTDFGTEVGSIAPNGNVSAEANGNPIALTSNGNAITVTQTADGYVGTINGGADTVFTITVDAQTGQYTYTQFEPLDHPDGTDPNDTIDLTFGVAVTSTDGDSDTGSITITVGDDGPIANDDVSGAEEGQTITGNVVVNDNFSEDVSNTVTEVEHDGTVYTIPPFGSVTFTTSLGGEITFNHDGTYTYTATDIGDPDGTDVFTYTLTDYDSDNDTAQLSIRVTPDGEPIAVTEVMTVDETNLTPGPLVINESVAIDFGLDGQGSFDPNGNFDFGGSAAGGNLTSGGQPVEVQQTADGYIGVIAGTTTKVFELIVQDNGDYSFELFNTLDHADATDPNDTIVLNFGMTIADSDGDTANGTITINVLDDAPVAFDDFNSVPQNQLTANGNVTDNDINGEDAPSNVTTISFNGTEVPVVAGTPTVINGDYGTLSINADGTYTYTSFGTNTTAVQDVFTYSLTDFDGDTDTAELTIDITDVDDQPIITKVRPLVTDETDLNPTDTDSSTIVADFGNDGPGSFTVTGAGTFSHAGGTNGQLTSNDVPVDIAVVGNDYVGTANGTEVFRLTLNETTGEYEFILSGPLDHADTTNPDDIIELTFGVTATDADGDTDTGSIVVQVKDDGPQANDDMNTYDTTNGATDGNVITGRNGGPGAADDLSEDNAAPESADHDVVQVSFGGTIVDVPAGGSATIEGDYGILEIFDNGEYTYTLKPGVTPPTGTTTSELNPTAADVSGNQTSFTKNGFVISIATPQPGSSITEGGDLKWHDVGHGAGVGIGSNNSGDNKVWPKGETLNVDPQNPATHLTVTLADIGSNNVGHPLTVKVYPQGGGTPVELTFNVPNPPPSDGLWNIEIDTADIGGALIDSIDLYNKPGDASVSFMLNNVVATHSGEDCIIDEFEYVLRDGDGDQDTAVLTFKGKDLTDDQPVLTTSEVTVDETDLDPTDEASNVVTADFGADVPGDITVTGAGTFNFNGAENNQLTSGGVPVVVSTQGTDTYVGTAGAETVFTLVVQPDGQYTFTLIGTLDHADETNPDDVIQLFFDVTATDGDGDATTGTITVNVHDDGPSISGRAAPIDEDGLVNGPISYTRTLTHDYGEDGAGEIRPTDTFMATYEMGGNAQTLTSGGEEIIVTQTANGYIGQTAGGETVFTLEVQNNGQYTYTQFAGIDHPDPNDGDEVIWLKFGVEIVDYDGDTAPATIVVDVHDAMPTAPNNSVFPVAEHGLENGPVVVVKNFNGGDFGGDGEGQYEYDGTFMLLGNSSTAGDELTSNGEEIEVTFNGNIATGTTTGGTVVFTMELDPSTGKHTFTLFEPLDHGKPDQSGAQDVVWAKFGVNIVDADGDSKPAMIQVDIRDDAPDAINDTDTVGDNETSTSGNVIPNDDLSADEPNTVTEISFNGTTKTVVAGTPTTIDGQYGTLTINSDGSYTYTTNGTNTTAVQDVFTYTLTDYDGDSDQADLTITVEDIDDQPVVISPAEVTVDETDLDPTDEASNSVTADFGSDTPGTYTVSGAGTFGFNGAENNQLTSNGVPVTVTTQGNSYVGKAGTETIFTLVMNENTGQYTFTLIGTLDHADETNPDDVIELTFGVTATDADGDTANGNIVVNVKDDGPSISGKASPIDEDGLVNGPISYTRTLNHDYGEDGAGEIRPTDNFMATYSMGGSGQTLTSDGVPIQVTATANGYVGTANGQTVFTLDVQNNGQYTYTQFAGIDHPDENNPDDVIWLKFGVEIVDYDGDTAPATITVDVHDAAPTAPNNSVFPVAEHGLENGPVVVVKNFNGGDFGGDGEGQYEYDGTFMLLGNSSTAGDELTSGGEEIEVTFNGNIATGTTVSGTVVFTMELDPSTGKHTFTLFEPLDHGKPDASGAQDVVWAKFGVNIVDADGDSKPAMIQVDIRDDAPDAKDDCNEFEVEVVNKDFNIVMALDISGSMEGQKIALLKSSVANLMTDFNNYQGGEIKVHLVPFATGAGAGETFTVTDPADFAAALAYIDSLSTNNGTTNYEAPLQSAIAWLQGASSNDPIPGADTYSYFVSDGEPNRYINASGNLASGSAAVVMGEISGTDGTNEIQMLQDLSTEVIGVGIGVNGTTLARLGQIDSDGNALDVQDPTDLEAALQATSPIKGQTSGNVITGEHGGPGAADDLSVDVDNNVTQIRFGTQTIDVPADGSNVTIDGQYGKLTINNTGDYSYELSDGAFTTETSYVFTKFNPPGSDNGGDIKKVQTSYNETTQTLNFQMAIDPASQGFTLALNNGPNPKGHGGELALIYFDASGPEPVITVYAFNGANTQTSYKDGSAAGGTQAPDKILSSLNDPDAFDITVTTDAHGNKVFSFEMDASAIQSHDPVYGPNGDWTGVAFDQEVGIWLHPVKNLDTDYNSDGFLCNWSGTNGYYDTSNQHTVKHMTAEGQTIDTFEYVLTDSDGDSDTASLTLKSTVANSSVFTGSDVADVIEGTDEGDVIIGGLGNDTLYGGEGADAFLYRAINEGVDNIKDFNAGEGDYLDVSALLQGYDALQDSINDFVFTTESNGNTVVSVDATGSGNAANATQIAILEAVTGLSAEDIIRDDHSQTTV